VSSDSKSLLEVRNLARQAADGTRLLSETSFSIHSGDKIVCQGNSGSGKTVLLRALAKLDRTDGEFRWNGSIVSHQDVPTYRAQVIYLQQSQQLREGTVRHALQEPFQWKANRHGYDQRRVIELLEGLGRTSSFLDAKTVDLSGGESQIVAIVRALQLEPTILLADEPSSALDKETTIKLEQLISDWLTEKPRALVWVTHDQQQADRIATRRFKLDAGRLHVDV